YVSSRFPGNLAPPGASPASGGRFGRPHLACLGRAPEPAPLRGGTVPLCPGDLLPGALLAGVGQGGDRRPRTSKIAANHLGCRVGRVYNESFAHVAPPALSRGAIA